MGRRWRSCAPTAPWAADRHNSVWQGGRGKMLRSNNILNIIVPNFFSSFLFFLQNWHSKYFLPSRCVWSEAHPQGRSLWRWPCDHSRHRVGGVLPGITNAAWEPRERFAGTGVVEIRLEEQNILTVEEEHFLTGMILEYPSLDIVNKNSTYWIKTKGQNSLSGIHTLLIWYPNKSMKWLLCYSWGN